ncbi:tail fiber protein [Vibrio phage phi-A318]|uniref:K1E endosialidase adaptor protein n=2 Tax=Kaohsiungvirus TaxID=2731674 RepID=A0A067YIW1_9CAUD|nr:tail fiber protein [Vibrio phage phi-A318]YP_009783898.1 tail fiber protein [Vibrio phage AS51]AGZ17764.1 K1E endosialidase adaptor protein [Vibrio phage phi-A318]AHC94074.1 K1E endosialidase adaptor protein [Vibrio phage AS51]
MAYSNLSFVRHVGDGVKTLFPLTVAGENMGYFRVEDIHTYVDDKEVPNVIQSQSPHIVSITPAPPAGSDVLIRREMPIEKPYADFSRGNNFGHRQVNNSFLQQLYLTQELIDGFTPKGFYMKQNVDYGGHVPKNLGDAVDPDDAVKKSVTDSLDNRLSNVEASTNVSSVNFLVPFTRTAAGGEVLINTGYSFNYCELSINGVEQIPSKSFNYMNGILYFAEPLEEGDEVFAKLGSLEKFAIGSSFSDYRHTAVGGEYSFPAPEHDFTALFINGVYQAPSYSYVIVGNNVHLAESLEEGDVVDLWYAEKPNT